jgi:hypothetical protein
VGNDVGRHRRSCQIECGLATNQRTLHDVA